MENTKITVYSRSLLREVAMGRIERRTQHFQRPAETPETSGVEVEHPTTQATQAMQAILRIASAETDPHRLASSVCGALVEHGGVARAWVGLFDLERGLGRPFAWAGERCGELATLEVNTDDLLLGDVAAEGRVLGDTSGPAVPFRVHGRIAGAIVLDLRSGERRTRALAEVTEQAAAVLGLALGAIEDRRALEETRARVDAQAARVAELEKLHRALEQCPVSVVLTDVAGNIEYVNRKFTVDTGYSAEEARGKNPRILKSGETSPEVYQKLWAKISSGGVWQGEFHNVRKDGELFWELALIGPVFDGDGRIAGYVAAKDDITRRRALEADARQADKLEAIGRLAGGVAHDFNNLLGITIAGAASLEVALADDPGLSGDAAAIRQACEQTAALTRKLLAFSRRQAIDARPEDLTALLRELSSRIRRTLGDRIELDLRLPSGPVWVIADRGQFEQMVQNLVVNAREAMPDGGRLTVHLEPARAASIPPGAAMRSTTFVRLTVADTGVGMDERTCQHLFEPFFTTKTRGVGRGLGLAAVHGIVEQAGGFIRVRSTPRAGTSFFVHLPAAESERVSPPLGHRGPELCTILLVDDEEGIRTPIARLLSMRGFRVLSADSAPAAIDVSSRHDGTIDLVLTDVVMPGGNGTWGAQQIRRQRPDIRVLYMSGYEDGQVHDLGPREAFIAKPFSPEQLLAKLRELVPKSLLPASPR